MTTCNKIANILAKATDCEEFKNYFDRLPCDTWKEDCLQCFWSSPSHSSPGAPKINYSSSAPSAEWDILELPVPYLDPQNNESQHLCILQTLTCSLDILPLFVHIGLHFETLDPHAEPLTAEGGKMDDQICPRELSFRNFIQPHANWRETNAEVIRDSTIPFLTDSKWLEKHNVLNGPTVLFYSLGPTRNTENVACFTDGMDHFIGKDNSFLFDKVMINSFPQQLLLQDVNNLLHAITVSTLSFSINPPH